ncbi:MAG: nitroreductase family protein [Fidelibacterota bacterium]|nr:MAG: nitroreductase family protein [Candidatus Neomarinimicrobiota bacterium]
MFKDLMFRSRSYRRFYQEEPVTEETLRELVELARLAPSAANMQPLKYVLSWEPERNAQIFPHLSWAGYLKDWPGPGEGERPSAYIVILGDRNISPVVKWDHGIVAQSMLLGASEKGLGGCMIGSIEKKELQKDLEIPAHYEILLVLALGKPKEKVVLETVDESGDIKYWRDEEGVHHVPKRPLEEVIVG